jgi:hypothetical protein
LSNAGTIAVVPPGQSFCTSGSLTEAQLRTLDQGGTLVAGSLELSKHTLDMLIPGLGRLQQKSEFVQGAFSRAGAGAVGTVGFSATQIGACTVYQVSGGASATGGVGGLLDAGLQLSLSGPNASATIPRDATMVYSATLYDSGLLGQGGSGNPTLAQGSYSITSNGGADIAAFTAKMDFPSDLVWTNEDMADPVSRSAPLTIHWTGGGTGLVQITGTGLTASTTSATGALFICTAQASAGVFTVPASVLQQLPVITNQGANGDGTVGTLAVMAITDTGKGQGLFSAPLKAGGTTDQTFLTYSIGTTKMTGFN